MVHGPLSAVPASGGGGAKRNAALSRSPSLALGLMIGSVTALLRCESPARPLPAALFDIAGQKCTASQVLPGGGNRPWVRKGSRLQGSPHSRFGRANPATRPSNPWTPARSRIRLQARSTHAPRNGHLSCYFKGSKCWKNTTAEGDWNAFERDEILFVAGGNAGSAHAAHLVRGGYHRIGDRTQRQPRGNRGHGHPACRAPSGRTRQRHRLQSGKDGRAGPQERRRPGAPLAGPEFPAQWYEFLGKLQ